MFAKVFNKPGRKVNLTSISTLPPKSMSRKKAESRFAELSQQLFELQDLMWGANTHGVLVVLQGRDSAGKDGTIKHVVGGLNPRGVFTRTVDMHIARLRGKLEDDPARPRFLLTVRSKGYMLAEAEA